MVLRLNESASFAEEREDLLVQHVDDARGEDDHHAGDLYRVSDLIEEDRLQHEDERDLGRAYDGNGPQRVAVSN